MGLPSAGSIMRVLSWAMGAVPWFISIYFKTFLNQTKVEHTSASALTLAVFELNDIDFWNLLTACMGAWLYRTNIPVQLLWFFSWADPQLVSTYAPIWFTFPGFNINKRSEIASNYRNARSATTISARHGLFTCGRSELAATHSYVWVFIAVH